MKESYFPVARFLRFIRNEVKVPMRMYRQIAKNLFKNYFCLTYVGKNKQNRLFTRKNRFWTFETLHPELNVYDLFLKAVHYFFLFFFSRSNIEVKTIC